MTMVVAYLLSGLTIRAPTIGSMYVSTTSSQTQGKNYRILVGSTTTKARESIKLFGSSSKSVKTLNPSHSNLQKGYWSKLSLHCTSRPAWIAIPHVHLLHCAPDTVSGWGLCRVSMPTHRVSSPCGSDAARQLEITLSAVGLKSCC